MRQEERERSGEGTSEMQVESGPLSAHDQLHTKARVTALMKKKVRLLVSCGIMYTVTDHLKPGLCICVAATA